MIKKLLIANRGEIACRVLRTAKTMGIETVAIYSDIDKHSKHVQMADQAFHVGGNPSAQSYLQQQRILDIALRSGCQAIHPGFGFLSENAIFADLCNSQDVRFVGPPSEAIRKMGSKSESKQIMEKAQVPIVPGYHQNDQNVELLQEMARKITYPVMIKAVMGGGGKGMRIVFEDSQFLESLESAKREAMKSFGDDRVIIEKYIQKPRHIECQIFGDHFGNYAYLFERDCSIQRRHQKIIEEAPSHLSNELRQAIGKSAVEAAKAVNYTNAGTVEFIFDLTDNRYYFMEMNTRLQVEHPISEMITGQDFVEWQLLVASNKPLPKKQEELKINGHSIEARIYSEQPFNDFLPSNGTLRYVREPENPNVRVESGVQQGDEISIFYDPMIAKLVVWGEDRAQAISQLRYALANYKILGLPTNIPFLKRVIDDPTFQSGEYDTGFIQNYEESLLKRDHFQDFQDLASSVVAKLVQTNESIPKELMFFRTNYALKSSYPVIVSADHLLEKEKFDVQVSTKNNTFDVEIYKEDKLVYECKNIAYSPVHQNCIEVDIGGNLIKKEFNFHQQFIETFDSNGYPLKIEWLNDVLPRSEKSQEVQKSILSPMPGTILKINFDQGQAVKQNDTLVIIEAMKMEHQIKAQQDGKIKIVHYKAGQFIEHGQEILELE